MKEIQYGIVILNYNTFEDTAKCINSIQENECPNIRCRVYIVDNNSPDGSGMKLMKRFDDKDGYTVILSDYNYGFSGGNNIGIRRALYDNCDYIFLLNSDIVLINNALSIMVEILNQNDDISIIGPSVVDPNSNFTQFARKGINLKSYICDKNLLKKIIPHKAYELRNFKINEFEDSIFQGMISGCCFGFKRKFIEDINCLDDKIFMYYEEDILAHIIKKTNRHTYFCSKAKVLHNEGKATEKINKDKYLFTRLYRWTSSLYVLWKYAGTNRVICFGIAILNILIWCCFSLFRQSYKNTLRKFIFETNRVMKDEE